MEQVDRLILEANNAFRTADHLAYVSYPLLRENRLLLIITKNLFTAALKAVDVILYYEKMHKRLNVVPLDFDSKIMIFEKNLAQRMNIKSGVCKVIRDLRFIVNEHKESPIEFSRKEKFIICNDDYTSMRTIDIDVIKSYIVVMREFVNTVNRLKNV